MLQMSKAAFASNNLNTAQGDAKNDPINNLDADAFKSLDDAFPDDDNIDGNEIMDKNPIINKRILLNVDRQSNAENQLNEVDPESVLSANAIDPKQIKHIKDSEEFKHVDANNTDQVVVVEVPQSVLLRKKDKLKFSKQSLGSLAASVAGVNREASSDTQAAGRIVVYGDSNCLDSTHLDKPCFWLLNAFLEYTMTSHISTLLKDLNRTATVQFSNDPNDMPKRLPNNNLHTYSKVLVREPIYGESQGSSYITKRAIPKCIALKWETPIFLNLTAPNNLQYQSARDRDEYDVDALGMNGVQQRKLESQKGEVCSDESTFIFF